MDTKMDFYFDEFIRGLNDGLTKSGEESSVFDITGSIFPNISTQTKWQFARSGEELHLHDGNHAYYFHLPEGEKDHDFPVTKVERDASHSFGEGASSKGTMQVHRANPGSIYFTLQDGSKNPTYTFKHVTSNQWRATPKVKATHPPIRIDSESFIKGAWDAESHGVMGKMVDALDNGIDSAGRGAIRGTMALGHSPLLSAGAGLAGGALYDIAKRSLYNTKEENDEETVVDRLKRYLIPAAGLGLTGAMAKNTFPNYYNEFPEYRP